MIAALYTHGRVVTGCNHGEAFGKLSQAEQDGTLRSGFIDESCGRFVDEAGGFYLKDIVLIRHGDCNDGQDPPISPKGQECVLAAADRLRSSDLSGYCGFTSPLLRCRQTATIISDKIHVEFAVEEGIREWDASESMPDFIARIEYVLAHLPPKAILVSHCDFILNAARLACGKLIEKSIPPASLTVIHDDQIVCVGS